MGQRSGRLLQQGGRRWSDQIIISCFTLPARSIRAGGHFLLDGSVSFRNSNRSAGTT